MLTSVQKWGNSLALRIPKPFAEEVGLKRDSRVELTVIDGKVIIEPVEDRESTLEAMLIQINDDNLHGEIDTGPPVGNEVW